MIVSCVFIAILFLINGEFVIGEIIYNPYFHFPGGSEPFMGIIVTIATPIEAGTPGDVVLSTILEGNYVIPDNQTQFEYPPIYDESTERTFLYEILKRKIEDFGYSGKSCLLRAICETSKISSMNTGVLGDIMHILLTPSASKREKKIKEYLDAEVLGIRNGCKHYKKLCPYNILNEISKIKFY